MKEINRIFLFLFFTGLSLFTSYAQEAASYFLHTIEKGQSLYSISAMYNVTTSDIIRLNPGCEEKIYAGQSLKIPRSQTDKSTDKFHTIQAGETLYRLTVLYKLSAKEICDANPGLSADNFKIGQVIRIPLKKQTADGDATHQQAEQAAPTSAPVIQSRCREMHRVKRKETIFSISQRYGITEEELIAINPELKHGMKKGQYLCIPYPKATAPPHRTGRERKRTRKCSKQPRAIQ